MHSLILPASMSLPVAYSWSEPYRSALNETDAPKLRARLLLAEQQMVARLRVLVQDHGGTDEERSAIADALKNIQKLRVQLKERKPKDNY